MVIPFDTEYTKVSCDSDGSYFDVWMSGLQPERYYRVLVKTELDGATTIKSPYLVNQRTKKSNTNILQKKDNCLKRFKIGLNTKLKIMKKGQLKLETVRILESVCKHILDSKNDYDTQDLKALLSEALAYYDLYLFS